MRARLLAFVDAPGRTFVLAALVTLCSFVIGQQAVNAQPHPCEQQCPHIGCFDEGFPGAGCDGCGQWTETVEVFRAGDRCIGCGVGLCHYYQKVDIDHCEEVCPADFWEQCLACLI